MDPLSAGCAPFQPPIVARSGIQLSTSFGGFFATGNIGCHHGHHLSPRIPNCRLEECHEANVGLHAVRLLTLGGALRALRCNLWDADRGCLVPFRAAARRVSLVRQKISED